MHAPRLTSRQGSFCDGVSHGGSFEAAPSGLAGRRRFDRDAPKATRAKAASLLLLACCIRCDARPTVMRDPPTQTAGECSAAYLVRSSSSFLVSGALELTQSDGLLGSAMILEKGVPRVRGEHAKDPDGVGL